MSVKSHKLVSSSSDSVISSVQGIDYEGKIMSNDDKEIGGQ